MNDVTLFKKYKKVDFLRYTLIILSSFLFSSAVAQFGAMRQVEKRMAEKNWNKSRQLINKLLSKDSLNMEARLALLKWFLASENPNYQIDSADHHTRWALTHFCNLSSKQKERLKKEYADSLDFVAVFLKIDSLSFEQSKNINSEKSYQKFIDQFPSSHQKVRAIELRDEVAYLDALRVNTFSSFADFLKKYPQALRAQDASQRYERLLFESKTKDKKLRTYETFVGEYPRSPYQEEALKNIFQIKTASGSPADFHQFILKYPNSKYATRATDILQYLSPEGEETGQALVETDSLTQLRKLNEEIWVPFYKNGKYGFLNEQGVERCAARFEKISPEYFCGNIKDEIISTSSGLYKRSGKIIFRSCTEVEEIGTGFLVVLDSIGRSLLHKSGRVVEENIDDAAVLNGRFLVLTKGERKALLALNGRVLIPYQKQSIEMIEGVIVVNRIGKKVLWKVDQVVAAADGNILKEEYVFDDVRPAGHHLLLIRSGALEGLLNENLEFVVPLGRQALQPTSFGLIQKSGDHFILSGFNLEVEQQSWVKYELEKQWLLLKGKQGNWLTDLFTKKVLEKSADSIWLSEGIAFAKVKDSIRVYLNSSSRLSFSYNTTLSFMFSLDSIRYFYTQQKAKKNIYDVKNGRKVLTTEGDKIRSVGENYFLAVRKKKEGLLSKSGRILLPFDYETILFGNQVVSLLKDKKFGAYNLKTTQLIKPVYNCNLTLLDSTYLIACRNQLYGIIDWSSKTVVPFEYEEILPVEKNQIWVRKNFEWSLLNYKTGKYIIRKVKEIRRIAANTNGETAIVRQENFYGVVNSKKGVIIPPTFSFVANVGSAERPLYFTSKEVEEAGVFVVIYYNETGQFLRKEVYEEDEYEKIVCKVK